MPRIALGEDYFENYRENSDIYVDKSLFIKDIFEDNAKIMLITRPRRFGKTLNMTMAKAFFEKSDTDKSHLFKDLKIWEAGKKYTNAQGQYPVIFMTLKEVRMNDWQECLNKLKDKIATVFRMHKEIITCLDEGEKKEYDEIIMGKAPQSAYESSLGKLCGWLDRYHGKKPMILIDEYDAPINTGTMEGYNKEVVGFMRNLFDGAMKTNPSLEKAILTGVTRIAGESLFSGLNNFFSYNVLINDYSQHFGFTEAETKAVMEACKVEHPFNEIKRWYDGYTFGEHHDIYNPWSIMCVATQPKSILQSYWVNSGSHTILKDQLAKKNTEIKETLYALIGGETRELPIRDDVSYEDLLQGTGGIWSFMLYAGYLTAEDVYLDHRGRKTGKFYIPNQEVGLAMELMVGAWLWDSADDEKGVDLMISAMLTGKEHLFGDRLAKYVRTAFSYFDTTGNEPELVYHAFLLGLLVHLRTDYYFSSNPEAGEGRADVLIMPKSGNLGKNAVILEFKKAWSEEILEARTDVALQQIRDKGYVQEAIKRSAETIYCYGIGFYKREIMLKMEVVTP